jgi:hypothetical protein
LSVISSCAAASLGDHSLSTAWISGVDTLSVITPKIELTRSSRWPVRSSASTVF